MRRGGGPLLHSLQRLRGEAAYRGRVLRVCKKLLRLKKGSTKYFTRVIPWTPPPALLPAAASMEDRTDLARYENITTRRKQL